MLCVLVCFFVICLLGVARQSCLSCKKNNFYHGSVNNLSVELPIVGSINHCGNFLELML